MLIADAIGIGVGIVMGKKIPERTIKWTAAFIFIFFGLSGLYELLPDLYLYPIFIVCGVVVLGFGIYEFTCGRKRAPAMPAPYCEPGEIFRPLWPDQGRLPLKPSGNRFSPILRKE